MNKTYLDFSNLINFCKNNPVDNDKEVYVSMEAEFSIEKENDDKYKQELIPFTCKAYHDNINANHSMIDPKVFIDNTKSIECRPVLANIVTNENGEIDFGSHDFHFDIDEDGNKKIVFDEKPVGVITNYGFLYDKESNVNRAVVNGFLFHRYIPEVVEIFNRRKNVSCSVELAIDNYHFDTDKNVLVLDDYFVSGVTLLGENHEAGMAGSEMTLESFSKENNSAVFNIFNNLDKDEVARIQENWIRAFSLSEHVSEKGEKEMDEEVIVDSIEEEKSIPTFSMSINLKSGDELVSTFEISLTDKVEKIRNGFYSWLDHKEYCYTDEYFVFEDHVIYKDWETLKYFKIGFGFNEEIVSFDEDEVEVTMIFEPKESYDSLKAEKDELESKLNEMSSILEEMKKEKDMKAKEDILANPVYSKCLDSEEFEDVIGKKESISAEEFEVMVDLAFAKFNKNHFKPTENFKQFNAPKEKKKSSSRYGNIFK